MRRTGIVVMVLALLGMAPGAAARDASSTEWIYIPFPIYAPHTGWMMTLSAIGSARIGEAPPSTLIATLAWSERNQKSVALDPALYLGPDWLLGGRLAAEEWPTDYFGLGGDTDADDGETYTSTNWIVELDLRRRFGRAWVGPMLVQRNYDIDEIEPGGLLATDAPLGLEGGRVGGLGLVASYDTRDDVLAPDAGVYLEGAALLHRSAFGSDFAFERYTLDGRQFSLLRRGWVLAFTQYLAVTRGEIPFQELSLLGEASPPARLRGYVTGRFRDRDMAVAQTELRFPLRGALGGVAFAGVGDVAPRLRDISTGDLKWSAGLGLRYRVSRTERINLRLDVGYTEDEISFYFGLLEAF